MSIDHATCLLITQNLSENGNAMKTHISEMEGAPDFWHRSALPLVEKLALVPYQDIHLFFEKGPYPAFLHHFQILLSLQLIVKNVIT